MSKNVLTPDAEPYYDDEIDLRELFAVLRAGKNTILAVTAVFALVSVIYGLSVPNQYKATALLAPAQSESGGLSGALGELGGLASLAGVDLNMGGGGDAQIAIEIMQSWSFVETFIANNDLSVEVFAADGWSRSSNQLQIDDAVYDVSSKTWLVKNNITGEKGPPSSWVLFEEFSEKLTVSQDKKTGLVSVSIEYYSPLVAKDWLDLYVKAINEHMQARQIAKVTNNINYLQAQIQTTNIAEMQEVFYTIIEEQIKNKMLAEASPDYAFLAVSPSMVPEEKSQPKRALICILSTLLGGMLSVLWVLVMHYARAAEQG
ncbi:MAG: Wzz/FepE/Etk N-terminal domain-containing protein [Porticoccaceae bacterium]